MVCFSLLGRGLLLHGPLIPRCRHRFAFIDFDRPGSRLDSTGKLAVLDVIYCWLACWRDFALVDFVVVRTDQLMAKETWQEETMNQASDRKKLRRQLLFKLYFQVFFIKGLSLT
jgi:hypothetical protein